MSLIQVEITADAVIGAMLEDGHFMLEMWRELAAALQKGMLLDDACDVLRQIPLNERTYITESLNLISELTDDSISSEGNTE